MSSVSLKLATPAGRWATIAARLAVAAVFVWAAVPKLLDPAGFAEDIANYHLLPDAAVGYVAAIVPLVELVVAGALITGLEARGAALVAAAMLAVFTFAMGQAMARGIDLSCGCFGSATTARVGWGSIARNAALLVASGFVVVAPEARWRSAADPPSP